MAAYTAVMAADVASGGNDWLARMDWLPVDELPHHFAEFEQTPPVLTPILAREWTEGWNAPYPVVLFDASKRTTVTDVFGMAPPDQWGRVPVAAEDELFRVRFAQPGQSRIYTRLVDIGQVWVLSMVDDQTVYWSDDTPQWPALAEATQFNFDHRVPVLDQPPDRPLPRILTRAGDQLGALTGRRGWIARVEPNAWEACVVVSEIYCATPSPSELEALRVINPEATFKQYAQVMLPANYWWHRITGEPMPSWQFDASRIWL
uniref:hypothetical protein n=1 Tax=Nocardia suismassiliense TaxID=2077092 RepID=UPI003F49A6CD